MPMATVPTPLGEIPAHLAVPAGAGPWPGVVVLHELLGLNDDIKAMADRFAREGYVAVTPDLFAPGNRAACLVRVIRDGLSGRGRTYELALACRDWLASRDDCTGRIGVAGFCLGGGFAIVLATRGFDVAAAQYGRLPPGAEQLLGRSCPMVASYGGRDVTLRGAAARLDRILTDADVRHDVKEYPDAGHAFMSPQEAPAWARPVSRLMAIGYVELAAADAWDRMLTMFAEELRPD